MLLFVFSDFHVIRFCPEIHEGPAVLFKVNKFLYVHAEKAWKICFLEKKRIEIRGLIKLILIRVCLFIISTELCWKFIIIIYNWLNLFKTITHLNLWFLLKTYRKRLFPLWVFWQLSTVHCPLSPPPTVHYQPSRLHTVHCPLHPLSTVHCPLRPLFIVCWCISTRLFTNQ